MLRTGIVVIFALGACASVFADDNSPATLGSAWDRFSDSRRNIKTMALQVEVRIGDDLRSVSPYRLGSSATYDIWFDAEGGRYRCDRRERRPNSNEPVAVRTIALSGGIVRAVPALNDAVSYETPQSALDNSTISRERVELLLQDELTLAPLSLGMLPSPFNAHTKKLGASLDALGGLFAGATAVPLDADSVSGEGYVTASFIVNGGPATMNYVLDPSKDYAPVQCSVTHVGMVPGRAFTQSLQSRWRQHTAGGLSIWFLESAVFQSTKQGELLNKEEWTVTVTSINELIDDSVFDWPALGLVDGDVVERRGFADRPTEVVEFKDYEFVDWNPTIVPAESFKTTDLALKEAGRGKSTFRHWIITANLVVVGAIVAAVVARRLRGNRQNI